MADKYLARLARVVPPRDTGPYGTAGYAPAAPGRRAIACNVSTTSVELDTDIFQLTPVSGGPATPGSVRDALVRFHAEGNDLYINFGAASTVVANSAAVSGNTMCDRIPAGQDRDYELNPSIDKWVSARTINGGALTATLRYGIVSFPTEGQPGSG
jgi:hypothetical protein